MKLAAYIPVSADSPTAENNSLDRQRRRILQWCKQREHTVVKFYEQIEDPDCAARPSIFEQMLTDATSSGRTFDGIVVVCSYSELPLIAGQLTGHKARGIPILSCTDDELLGELVTAFSEAVMEMQRRQTSGDTEPNK
ncbi:hypothetical protein F6455_04345 [Proteobacteria bacterium 005FR1]|nr:hypothetical protein [Proteobacteria bacterium 005FR1]